MNMKLVAGFEKINIFFRYTSFIKPSKIQQVNFIVQVTNSICSINNTISKVQNYDKKVLFQ